jgi:RHS repeat-associated protein
MCSLRRGRNVILPGQYYDAETGLNYNYQRDYDPSTGRYEESDPILQPTRYLTDGKWEFVIPYTLKVNRSFLPYVYVADQPTMATDKRGMVWGWDFIKCMYYSNKYLNAVQDCKRRAGTCTIEQLHFMQAYNAPSLSDAIFKCGCQNSGVCLEMFESCGSAANGKPKM